MTSSILNPSGLLPKQIDINCNFLIAPVPLPFSVENSLHFLLPSDFGVALLFFGKLLLYLTCE